MVKVRLFAALRELAGSSEVEAEGRTAGDVADALSARFGERFARIAAVGSLVVNGDRANRATPVAAGDEVALLPPVSGGSRRAGPPSLLPRVDGPRSRAWWRRARPSRKGLVEMRRGIRPARLMAVGVLIVVSLVAGAGSAVADEGVGGIAVSGDDPVGDLADATIDELEETTEPIADELEETTDPITDQLGDTVDPVVDEVDDAADPVVGVVDDAAAAATDLVGGTAAPGDSTGGAGDPASGPATGGSGDETAPTRNASVASPTRAGRLSPSSAGVDTDDVAASGDRVLEGAASQSVCIGIVPDLCLDLVGGSDWLGILYRALEQGRDVFSAFVDSLPLTGSDLLAIVGLALLAGVAGTWMVRRGGRDEQPGHGRATARPRA